MKVAKQILYTSGILALKKINKIIISKLIFHYSLDMQTSKNDRSFWLRHANQINIST